MWESPVNIVMGKMQTQIEGEIYKAIQNVGIDVDKEQLIKAIQYDRNQYEKGYKDGYADGVDEFANRLYSKIKAEIDDCAYELDWIDMEETGATCEVIGNKFDNPELLNTTETIGYADNGGLMSAT